MSGTTDSEQTPTTPTKAPIPKELLDQLLEGYQGPEDLLGADGLFKRLTAALVNRVMDAELTHHLGYEAGKNPPEGQRNRRNGKGRKRLRTDQGPIDVEVPRDREGSFEPQIVPKHQRHFNGFDDKIVSMYARGMSTREIQGHVQEIYGVEVSPDLVSRATAAVVDELAIWQCRPLDAVYPVVYLDALVVKVRDKGVVQNKAVYLVVGLDLEGRKHVLGMWIESTEGAKFWLVILDELRQRGVQDIFVLCADGLTGLPQAVEAAFPRTIFQTCVVHMIRSSTRFVPWKERRALCADLRGIYTAMNEEQARLALEAFEGKWGARFPMIGKAWRARWGEITPFLAFPPEIRRAVYTTNAIEALNRQVRKVLKTRGHMPTDEAALKLIYLAIRNAEKTWGDHRHSWSQALLQFSILFADRMPA
jgi:putative transposase